MTAYLHVELAEDLGPGEDAEGDLVDAVVLHVEGVDGGELRGSAYRVRLEAVPGQGQTGQVDQAGQEALGGSGVRGQRSHTLTSKPANNHQPIIFISGCFLVWLLFHQLISFFPACFVALALHLEGLHLDGLHLSISWGFLCPYFVDLKRQVATVSSVGRSLGLTQKHKKQSSASRYHVKLTCFSVIIFM